MSVQYHSYKIFFKNVKFIGESSGQVENGLGNGNDAIIEEDECEDEDSDEKRDVRLLNAFYFKFNFYPGSHFNDNSDCNGDWSN